MKEIKNLSARDKVRLFQCVCCANDLDTCNVDDDDEHGMCRQYRKRVNGIDFDESKIVNEYERCWLTGNYEVDDCLECHHKHECSGYSEE